MKLSITHVNLLIRVLFYINIQGRYCFTTNLHVKHKEDSFILYTWCVYVYIYISRVYQYGGKCKGLFTKSFISRRLYWPAKWGCIYYKGAGVAQLYNTELRTGWFGFRVTAGAGNFSLYHRVQTGSETHPPSCPMGTSDYFSGGKAAGEWSWPLISI
jgi:hypothetical protein